MNNTIDLEFYYKGHQIHVCHEIVRYKSPQASDTVFSVLIDGAAAKVPGIWQAYQMDDGKGIELVIKAYLDGS